MVAFSYTIRDEFSANTVDAAHTFPGVCESGHQYSHTKLAISFNVFLYIFQVNFKANLQSKAMPVCFR